MFAFPAGTTAADDKEAKESAATIYFDMIAVLDGCDYQGKSRCDEGYMIALSMGEK